MHVTLVPYIKAAGELKTKPTQQSVAKLREIGLQPQVIICRTEMPLDAEVRQVVADCNVPSRPSLKQLTSKIPSTKPPSTYRPRASTKTSAGR